MTYRFEFRRYRLPLKAPVRTSRAVMTEREGVIVRLERDSRTGLGEAAPLAGFGGGEVEEIASACGNFGAGVEVDVIERVPRRLGCLRNALAAALAEIGRANADEMSEGPAEVPPYLPVAALVPAGRRAIAEIQGKGEAGFRTFKWKVGVGDLADELALFDDVCAALPSGAKLRLDANGAWDRRHAERWLERCAERPVEFVEQPCFAEASAFAAAVAEKSRGRAEDLLLGLAADFPTPLALDESVAGDADVERWLGRGWPGVFVIKPSLHADLDATLARLATAKAKVVFSSALETAVGARAALRRAFVWPGERRALGFGVWPLFADPRLDGPAAAPFLRREDLKRIDVEAAWNVLS
ncbi:MAG TPA: o-succinylbenzoate synthase [Opitutus sp.]|nr:o-succinylbenzoate synthase [Opitutus sp.]